MLRIAFRLRGQEGHGKDLVQEMFLKAFWELKRGSG
jgi:DNA-directed RNA polymerase specialized sigma24 family protein